MQGTRSSCLAALFAAVDIKFDIQALSPLPKGHNGPIKPWKLRFCLFVCLFIATSLAQWLRRPPREREISGSNPARAPVTSKLALRWLPCQAPGVIGSVLGLVGPVSVYCDWVRCKIRSAASISVWQHVKLSERTRP